METVLILDFGAQYSQLIARRVREQNVYCEVKPCSISPDEIRKLAPIGIILSGGPQSVYESVSLHVDPALFSLGVPVLGICYGCQLMAYSLGGTVAAATEATAREYGKTLTEFDTQSAIFHGLPASSVTWMSHGDYISQVPDGFTVTAKTAVCPTAAMACPEKKLYGVQFHPEVQHTVQGSEILRRFLYSVCGASGDWTMADYRQTAIRAIREKVGSGRALLALSGGVDSSVAAALMAEAIGSQLTCVFVDHGLMRKNEGDEVEAAFGKWDIHFIRVIGDITKEKLDTLRDADFIFRDEIAKAGLDRSLSQYFAVLTSMRSVGVMGDGRTYDYTLALRAVNTSDFMTADWSRIPYDVLDRISVRIVNEVRGINRICYDITSKPPATIEWE